MGKILDMEAFRLYKKARKMLDENSIPYNSSKLMKDPELCREILTLLDCHENKDDS